MPGSRLPLSPIGTGRIGAARSRSEGLRGRDFARHGPPLMLAPDILLAAVLNGLMTGAVYALVAVGLTLVYGVLHIINFAHGAILSAALFAAYFA